ncbi:MAG: SRPBCC domain-containing protein [Isosphaeraceae bacterium]|nr:SRPBCC domain-containing protein [Isosphaeraceae bacterium]
MSLTDLTMEIAQEITIKAPAEDVFRSLLARLGEENGSPDGKAMPMVLEAWPGGRWFRDLGGQAGHLWGFVQVIKPPTLLEFTGPMFMSYAAVNHVQFRLTHADGETKLAFRHRAMGMIEAAHRTGATAGWGYMLTRIKERAEG